MPNPVFTARSRVALATRYGDPTAAAEARRDLAAAKIEAVIRKSTADAPALTTEQTARLVDLLLEGAAR